MSLGSPALAAYSLMVTSFNARTVYNKANHSKHKKKGDLAKALAALQQTALELTEPTEHPHLLKSIRGNRLWKREILKWLRKRNAWSLTTGFSVAWVVVAFIFTLIDSFVSLNDPDSSGSEGLAVGTLWLWLLCLVIGWLWVPIFSCEEVNAALRHANKKAKATKDTTKEPKQQTGEDSKQLSSGGQKCNPKTSEKSDASSTSTTTSVDENEKVEQGSTDESETRAGDVPELRSTPFDTSLQAPSECQQDHGHLSVGGIQTAQRSAIRVAHSSEAPRPPAAAPAASLKHEYSGIFILKKEAGHLHTDEFRHPATFNYSRIMWYLVFVDKVFSALENSNMADEVGPREMFDDGVCLTSFQQEKGPSTQIAASPTTTTFPPTALWTMFKSAIFALLLQVGITGAALVVIIFTPTVGLGCRSLGYIVYAGVSIVIMFLSITSTILARFSEMCVDESSRVKGITACFAITLRWICYLLALANSVGLVALSCLQFSNALASCYCNSSVLGNGTDTYIIIDLRGWVTTMRSFRAVGIVIAAGSISVFMISLGLISSPPKEMKAIY